MKRLIVLICATIIALGVAGCCCWDDHDNDCDCPTTCRKVVVTTSMTWTSGDTTYTSTTTSTEWITKPDTTELGKNP